MVACKHDPETTADYVKERGFLGYFRGHKLLKWGYVQRNKTI
jgi:hypothetical protein